MECHWDSGRARQRPLTVPLKRGHAHACTSTFYLCHRSSDAHRPRPNGGATHRDLPGRDHLDGPDETWGLLGSSWRPGVRGWCCCGCSCCCHNGSGGHYGARGCPSPPRGFPRRHQLRQRRPVLQVACGAGRGGFSGSGLGEHPLEGLPLPWKSLLRPHGAGVIPPFPMGSRSRATQPWPAAVSG